MERAVVNEDSGADSGGSAVRMDAARCSEECSSETRLGVEAEVVIDIGGEEGVEDAER